MTVIATIKKAVAKSNSNLKSIFAGQSTTLYNPSAPFISAGSSVVLKRKESFSSETDSRISVEINGAEAFILPYNRPLQDPFYCGSFAGKDSPCHVIGAVEITLGPENRITDWRTAFFKYTDSIEELKDRAVPFARSPDKTKDIRLQEISPGRIAVFTRPQNPGGFGGAGTIGYMEVRSLDELETGLADYARKEDETTLLTGLLPQNNWGGVNQLVALSNGWLGVLAHQAHYDGPGKRYEAITFAFNPDARKWTAPKIILRAEDIPDFAAITPKRPELRSVVFPGGLVRHGNGQATLNTGVGDSVVRTVDIPDPFAEYESTLLHIHSADELLLTPHS